jgi:hypothetical protein
MDNRKQDEVAQRFPNKNQGQDLERDQQVKGQTGEDERMESDANPLRDRRMPNEKSTRQGNSSIPMDEEDTLGIP